MGAWRVEELFDEGRGPFADELRKHPVGREFAQAWHRDGRAWARAQLHRYLDRPLDAPEHAPLVKRLFKLAEEAGDDRTMAHFLAALDRSIRRERGRAVRRPLFSPATRRYLRRRAWRYFRRLGRRDLERFAAAAAYALTLYGDDDVRTGGCLLDCWGLTHILFHHHAALAPRPNGWTLKRGRALSELSPAPAFPEAWTPDRLAEALRGARCRPVRWWASELLRARGDREPAPAEDATLDRLARAIRSGRAPARRAAVSEAMTLVERRPELAGAVRRALPELRWT